MKSSTSILVQDTETRNEEGEAAYEKVRAISSLYKRDGLEVVYKKIDSSLRGNLGAELQALLDVSKRPIIVCPTFPENQRTLVSGHLEIRGIPVDKTKFAMDPVSPVRSSDIGKMISLQTTEKVAKIPLISVRKGSRSLIWAIQRFRRRGFRIICVDAESRADLRSIAAACLESHALPCGSAGLAEEVAGILQPALPKVVVLSSTVNEATLTELRRIARNPRVALIQAKAPLLTGNLRRREIGRIRHLAEKGLTNHEVIIVCSALYQKDFDPLLISRASRTLRSVASGLADAIGPLARSGTISGVLLTGGDMAAAFLKNIHASELRLEKELLPGIPLGRVVLGKRGSLMIVTKAGGFGLRGSMQQIVNSLISL